MRNAPIN